MLHRNFLMLEFRRRLFKTVPGIGPWMDIKSMSVSQRNRRRMRVRFLLCALEGQARLVQLKTMMLAQVLGQLCGHNNIIIIQHDYRPASW